MATNWIRDVAFNRGSTTSRGYMPEMWLMAYHMLRCAGYRWIWECDGQQGIKLGTAANPVADGNMEDAGTADWTPAGLPLPTVGKSITTRYSGLQSLEVTGELGGEIQSTVITNTPQSKSTTGGFTALGGGVMRFSKGISNDHDFSEKDVGRSITFVGADSVANDGTFTITSVISGDVVEYTNVAGVSDSINAGLSWWIDTPIHIAIWVNNPGGQTWNVDVDRGDGSPVTAGSFGLTSGWEIKHFDFVMQSNGGVQIFLRPQGVSSTIHIDGILMFRSFFEFTNDYEDYAYGDSGGYVAQVNPDEFESSNYTFVADDVGKFLLLFDKSGNHPKNTGCYAITSINAGRAVLDLRSQTAALTSQDGSVDALSWRMVDIYKWASSTGNYNLPNDQVEVWNGFGIESPHSSKWRFVCRGAWIDGDINNSNGCVQWSAPRDTELDIDTGNFFITGGPSIQGWGTQRNKTIQELNITSEANFYADASSQSASENMNWMRGRAGNANFICRVTMMFESVGRWFFLVAQPDTVQPTAGLFGLVGQDIYHPGDLAHCHLSSRDGSLTGGVTRDFLSYIRSDAWWYHGEGIGRDGYVTRIGCGQLGYSSSDDYFWEQSNAQANPFDGDEWLQPVLLLTGSNPEGSWSEREAEGIYQGRSNLPNMSTFGNENGDGDSFSIVGTTVTLTDAAGLFTASMIGKEVTITGATTPGNNGTFIVTGQTANTLVYENATGATEGFTGGWSVNMAKYLHITNGLCIDWMEERLAP